MAEKAENVEKVKTRRRSRNIFAAYFTPFGLRQICDLLFLAGTIVIIVGLSISTDLVITIGLGIYIAACLIAMYRALKVMVKKGVNKRSPEFKSAMINLIIMSVILVVAVLGMLAVFLQW